MLLLLGLFSLRLALFLFLALAFLLLSSGRLLPLYSLLLFQFAALLVCLLLPQGFFFLARDPLLLHLELLLLLLEDLTLALISLKLLLALLLRNLTPLFFKLCLTLDTSLFSVELLLHFFQVALLLGIGCVDFRLLLPLGVLKCLKFRFFGRTEQSLLFVCEFG